jgi:O-antigen/teichoic acid export membrane protein
MTWASFPWRWPTAVAASHSIRARFQVRRTFVAFVLSVAAVNGSSLLGNAFAFRWIAPPAMGIWHTLLLANSYMVILRLGLINGMGREMPFAIGAGDRGLADRIAATSLAYSVACSVAAALLLGLAELFPWAARPEWRLGLAAMAVVSAANLYLAYLQATFRSDSDFERLARVQWAQAAVGLLLPAAVYVYGFRGLCGHAVVQSLVVTTLAHVLRPFKVAVRFDRVLAGRLLATGFPLFVAGYLQTVATGFDRVILLRRAGVEAVGYYAPAVAALAAMAIVPGGVASYVYPRMSYALGRGRSPRALRRMALAAAASGLAAGFPIALAGWLAAPAAIGRFFPRYLASVPAVRLSLVAGLLWSVAPAAQVLGSVKAWGALSIFVGTLLVSRWALPWLLSRGGETLEGVARGNVAAASVMAVVSLGLVWRATASAELTG